MKKIIVFLALSGLISFAAIGQSYTISGTVRYYYDWQLIDSTRVYLMDSTKTKISWTTASNSTAAYSFSNLAPGTYYVGIDSSWTNYWGGSNSTDAWMIAQHFAGIITLSGIPLLAADVSADGIINSLDAYMVQQRFVHIISSFDSGDWVLNADHMVVITNGNETQHIETGCFGEVNHTANPY